MRAWKRVVGLPAHQPWCHKPRLDWTIWHTACSPANPRLPSRHLSTQSIYLSINISINPSIYHSFIHSFNCLHFFAVNHRQAASQAQRHGSFSTTEWDCHGREGYLLLCLLFFFVFLSGVCPSVSVTGAVTASVAVCPFVTFLLFSVPVFRFLFCSLSHAFMQQPQHDVTHICWTRLTKEVLVALVYTVCMLRYYRLGLWTSNFFSLWVGNSTHKTTIKPIPIHAVACAMGQKFWLTVRLSN